MASLRSQSRAGEPGGGRHAVLHAVLAELGPALAPQVGRGLGAVDAAHHVAQFLDALGDAAMHLADAEHRVLVAALGDGAADAGGLEHVDRDQRGHHAHGLAPADHARDALLVQAVLQRHDEAVGRQVLLDQRRRPFGVVGLHRDEGDVDRLLARQVLHLGEMHGLGVLDRDLLLRRDAIELQPAAADGLDVLRPEVDQGDVLAAYGRASRRHNHPTRRRRRLRFACP